jgi:hypothetical protein
MGFSGKRLLDVYCQESIMKNYVISMNGEASDPLNMGDTKSWFFAYKWRLDEDDEVFFPVRKGELPDIAEGDTIWFLMDEQLIGCATVLRIMPSTLSSDEEIWYHTKACKRAKGLAYAGFGTGPIDEACARALSRGLIALDEIWMDVGSHE